jgi:WhiB family redox-sensing transcriptional regulator
MIPLFDGTQSCKKVPNPDMFFPHPTDKKGIKEAKEVCNSCKFIAPCLEYAIWEPSLEGIWGGTTWRQRQNLRTVSRKKTVYS